MRSRRKVIERDGQKYVVITARGGRMGFEALIFPCDERGNPTRYVDVMGADGTSRQKAMDAAIREFYAV